MLLGRMQGPTVMQSIPTTTPIFLPEFDPDNGDYSAKSWCRTVDVCLAERPIQGSELIMALSRALKGGASAWLSQVNYAGMNWKEFREIFLAQYDTVETPAGAMMRINAGKPREGECMSSYANRVLAAFTNLYASMSMEQIVVASTLKHCVQLDPRLQRLAFTANIITRASLQKELMAFDFRKRPATTDGRDSKSSDSKKSRSVLTCFTCGKIGHKAADCCRRQGAMKVLGPKPGTSESNRKPPKKPVTCFKCGEDGHIAPQCKKEDGKTHPRTFTERRINLCSIAPITAKLTESDIVGSDKELLIELLNKFSESFVIGTPMGRVNSGELQIRLMDPNRTVQRRPYRLSPDERQIVRDKIDELLSAGIIRHSCSPFASPIILVSKKDGSDRLCVDYRELNSNTVPDRYPLPLISDQIQRLSGSQYFTTLDMASGFHQIPIHKDSIEKTAFVTPDGQYEYLSMPFGLRNAPSVFQRAINQALSGLVNTFVVCYLDDIMIPAESIQQSLERLQLVLERLKLAGFSLNLNKCAFLKSRVEYLGFEVTAGKIRPNPRKIKALTESSRPSTVTQLRQFIGLASYFRQFIPKFSQVISLLYKLTTGKGKIEWKPQHEKIRQDIIGKLTNEPIKLMTNRLMIQKKISFIIDSGATDHVVKDIEVFKTLSTLDKPIKISVAKKGEAISATKIGTIDVTTNLGATGVLENVLYAPEATTNLLSVRRIQQSGMTIIFGESGGVMVKKGERFKTDEIKIRENQESEANDSSKKIEARNDSHEAVELNNEKSWQESLEDVQLALNCTMNRITKHSPLELPIGKVARPISLSVINDEDEELDLSDIREQATQAIDQNAVQDKTRFDSSKAKIIKFSVGNYVLIENHERNQTKLDAKFRGPYKIIEVLPNDRYRLKPVNGNRILKYAHERLRLMPDSSVPMELDMCNHCSDVELAECASVGDDNSEERNM
ncbi:uncharacterized protein LOC143361002 [Halictus rubicundus]|uniref:uncharacterized protein LOC143361002 n=1 Tax=Halictus rubicundus TaxID=77578 RepID=UPI004035B5AF